MQVIVNTLMVSYDHYGNDSAPIALLLHGWGDRAAGLRGLAEALVRHNYQVLVPDLPGFGNSSSPDGAWGLDEYADFVAQLLAKLDKRPIVVIGHSNGGAISIRGIARGKIRSEKLVLLASAGIRAQYDSRRKSLRMLAKTAKIPTLLLPPSVRDKVRKKAYGAIGSDMFVAEHLQETFKKIITDDVQADASNLRIPTLLIYGKKDTATPVEYGERFTELIPGSVLRIIPNAGHFVHIDAAESVYSYIGEFIA